MVLQKFSILAVLRAWQTFAQGRQLSQVSVVTKVAQPLPRPMGLEVTGFEAFLYRLSDFSKALMLPVVLVIPRLSRLALATVLARTLNYCMLLGFLWTGLWPWTLSATGMISI